MANRHYKPNGRKVDAVFIRKSSQGQDEGGQKANVASMLKELEVYVPDDFWFVGTVSRRKVKTNAEFNRLMELVDADRIRTVYVESQDRWGTADRPELFSLLGTLRQHNTKLFDLRAKKDLTERDLATELLAFVGSIKSEKELQDISYRSLRTRVNNFLATGSWPTGTHPFGFGKACRGPDGSLKWTWQPVNRSVGQVWYPGPDGLTAGPAGVKIPRKHRQDIIKLVPNNNPDYVRAVRLVFDLYVREGLSRRQISARLNAEGLVFNLHPFSHPNVTGILTNPAYVGDTVFGKVQTGELHTFDAKGLIVEVKKLPDDRNRDVSQCLVMPDTHEALVDRKTWALAQEKLASERERTSYAPRNPAYYLKQLFVCGHCGKSMAARTENGGTVVYVCSSYLKGRSNGHEASCGYHRITHEDAERLLLEKIGELNLPLDKAASVGSRENFEKRLARLGHEDEESEKRWADWIEQGINALMSYLDEAYDLDVRTFRRLRKLAARHYWEDEINTASFGHLPVSLREFKRAVHEAERAAVAKAERKLAELRTEHRTMTLQWAKATDDMQVVLKQEIDRLEDEVRRWEPRSLPVTQRLESLYQAEAERQTERERLLAEWSTLENREKGESLRRHFRSVRLFWDREFHPARENPSRPRKTDRPGRYAYKLRRDRTEWQLPVSDLGSSR